MSIEDALAIQRVLATYCQLMDDGRFERLANEVFAEEGAFVDRGEASVGPRAIKERLDDIHPPPRRGKHVYINPIIDITGDTASVTSDFVFLGWREGRYLVVRSAGRYVDDFVRRDGRWQISRRDIEMLVPPSSA